MLVCAVRLNKSVEGLKDSKCLSKSRRLYLSEQIKLNADIGYGWVSPRTIDELGLSSAIRLAVRMAVDDISPRLLEEIIIDGNVNYLPTLNARAVVRADQTIHAVSAASIMAKVARDKHMHQLAKELPVYGFEKHVGYGTAYHIAALGLYGLSDQHRLSFKPCRQFINCQPRQSLRSIGG